MLEAKFHEEWMSPDKRLTNLEKDEQELKEFDKNETVVDIQGVVLVDHVINNTSG